MEDLILRRLQEDAMVSVMECLSYADTSTICTRIGELRPLHVAASMDIEKTKQSLTNILAYKKETAIQMLICSDEQKMKQLAGVIKHADDLLRDVLGMYH